MTRRSRSRSFSVAQARRRVASAKPSNAAIERAREYDRIHERSRVLPVRLENPTYRSFSPHTHTYQARRTNPSLCYDAASGTLQGNPQSPYFGLAVELVDLYADTQSVRIRHESLPDTELVVPLCPDDVVGDFRATPMPTDTPQCCVDRASMTLVCEDPSFRLHGATVEQILTEQPDGLLSVRFIDPAGGVKNGRFNPCQPRAPQCCYDVAAGTLRCDGGNLDGATVALIAMHPQPDGSIHAVVQSAEAFGTHDPRSFPLCDDPVTDCCYDPSIEQLVCPGTDLDGVSAGIISAWTGTDGQIYVWAAWDGGGARMPLCAGTECPPVFCCINMQTTEFVCPGRPELNGRAATLSDIVVEDGYSWGILDDGTRVPLCGKDCPPPRLCPECPTCPPGQWMSPDGTCHVPPARDPCPPGQRLESDAGTCAPCRKPNPCCDGCAQGHGCEGDKAPNPRAATDLGLRTGPGVRHVFRRITPILSPRNPGRRKRRIFAGNR